MSERPRVLQMGPFPRSGGGMQAVQRAILASSLARSYRLDVVATYREPGKLRGLLDLGWALARLTVWSLAGRGRIVHVHVTVRGSAYRKSICVLLAKALRRRVVLHVHSGVGDLAYFVWTRDRLSLRLLRTAFGAADVVLAVSQPSAEALEAAFGLDGVEVVPNPAPVVTPFQRPAAADGAVLAAYLGGFANPVKGGEVLVAALERALPQAPDLRVTLAGPGEPPASAAALIAREPRVAWAGWLGPEEKDALLREAAVFLMPSQSEGLPMALLEAMAYGMAIVATEAGGIPEVVDAGADGLLVPVDDPEALAEALCRVVADAGLRQRLSAAAAARARELDADAVAAKLAAIYARLG